MIFKCYNLIILETILFKVLSNIMHEQQRVIDVLS